MDNTSLKELEPFWENWYIDHFIGEGSFGKVYRIYREEFGEKHYAALKIISIPRNASEMKQVYFEGMNDESASQYFSGIVEDIYNEIILMSKLKGKTNIVSYEDHNIVQRKIGVGYDILIRMELLTSLNDYVLKKSLSNYDVVRMGIEICNALTLCEKRNIIHRDIKPDNIFLSNDGDFKLGDFGIAKQMDEALLGLSIKGSYEYMAPEVYNGKPYDNRVDIYSLGLLLYTFLNNRKTPFVPTDRNVATHGERQEALKRRFLGETLNKPVSASDELSKVVLKACAYQPDNRYTSAKEFKNALESLSKEEIGGEPSVSLADFFRKDSKEEAESEVPKTSEDIEDSEDSDDNTVMISKEDDFDKTVMLIKEEDYDKTVVLSDTIDKTVCLTEDDLDRTVMLADQNRKVNTVKETDSTMSKLKKDKIKNNKTVEDNSKSKNNKEIKDNSNDADKKKDKESNDIINKDQENVKLKDENKNNTEDKDQRRESNKGIVLNVIKSGNKIISFTENERENLTNHDRAQSSNELENIVKAENSKHSKHDIKKSFEQAPKQVKGLGKRTIAIITLAASVLLLSIFVIVIINHREQAKNPKEIPVVANSTSPLPTKATETMKPKETKGIVDNEPTKMEPHEIDLHNKKIASLTKVDELEIATDLNLEFNKISDITELSKSINLISLNLNHNKISDIKALSGLTKLQFLWLTGNKIVDISSMSNLKELTLINLDYNKIHDIDSLKDLSKVTALYLNNNDINDISALKNLTSMTALNLSNNNINDFSSLYHMKSLGNLDISGNKISKSDLKKLKKKLPHCSIIY